MRKSTILFGLFGGLMLVSCDAIIEKTPKYQVLKEEKEFVDSLYNDQKIAISDILTELQYIEDNFAEIKQSEGIFVDDSSLEGKDVQGRHEVWEENFNFIKSLLDDNRARMEVLQGKLDRANAGKYALQRKIKEIQEQLDSYDAKYASLEEVIAQKEAEIRDLNDQIQEQKVQIALLQDDAIQKEEVLKNMEDEMNEVYYLGASKKSLKSSGIIGKNDSFSSSKLMQKGASSAFEKADMREMKEITFETKKALILTTHPGGSYTLVKDKGTVLLKFLTLLNSGVFLVI